MQMPLTKTDTKTSFMELLVKLFNRTQCILLDGTVSNPAPVFSGVRQGTIVGPLLFLFYINNQHWSIAQQCGTHTHKEILLS